jgi:hypothetical protein
MLRKRINKRADMLVENVVFILLVLAFFGVMFIFVWRAGSNVTIQEQVYAKEIALIIDKARPGTEIELDINNLYEIAKKQNFDKGQVVKISSESNVVRVTLTYGGGYEYSFFSDADVAWNLEGVDTRDNTDDKLVLKIR